MLSRRAFLGACALLPLAACAKGGAAPRAQESIQSSFFCFDTVCALGGVMPQDVLEAAVVRCQDFEQMLSRTIATSDVGRINVAKGEPVQVAPETADLISQALRYCEESDGLFDITIGAVTELWDFHEGIVPDESVLEEAVKHVGWQGVAVDLASNTVTLADPDARLDLGGIAKGYVTDVIVAQLADAGVQSAFVNLGGNVAVLGNKSDGTPWRIGVRDPWDPAEEKSVAVVHASSGSVVTSGLYERQFEKDGHKYWHILDPRTGYPVSSDIVSASIYSEQSVDGDGFTKPPFMLGCDEAFAFLDAHDLDALLIKEDGTRLTTSNSAFEIL